jgi:hypothetical protein
MRWLLRGLFAFMFIALSVFSFYQYTQIRILSSDLAEVKETIELPSHSGFASLTEQTISEKKDCDETCKTEIDKAVSAAIAKITITPAPTTAQKQAITTNSTAKQTTYVSLGSGSTVNSDWETLDDSAVVMDLKNDYSSSATVSWEASLKVANGNGTAYARLYDATHNIAVDGSEFSVAESSSFIQRTSKNLPFWNGRNTYKVQIKSLNGYEVTVSGGRLKIQY